MILRQRWAIRQRSAAVVGVVVVGLFACQRIGETDTATLPAEDVGAPQIAYSLTTANPVVNFVAVKNATVTVPGTIPIKSAEVSRQGRHVKAEFVFDLAGVKTGDPRRDLNVAAFFFAVSTPTYTTATLRVDFRSDALATFPSDVTTADVLLAGELDLHGVRVPMTLPLRLSSLPDGGIGVSNDGDIVLSIGRFGLDAAADALMKVCGHKSLSRRIPISFDLALRPRA